LRASSWTNTYSKARHEYRDLPRSGVIAGTAELCRQWRTRTGVTHQLQLLELIRQFIRKKRNECVHKACSVARVTCPEQVGSIIVMTGNDKVRGIWDQWSVHARSPTDFRAYWPPIAPTLPASLQSNWHLTVSTKFKLCNQRACFGHRIGLSYSRCPLVPVNELLRRIGISISSYAIAADQVESFAASIMILCAAFWR
jgi:hypothetical protein